MSRGILSRVFAADDQTERAPREWPRFMTARVAADYCDTSPWTIRRNVVPCGRRGRSFVYAIEAVESWMRGAALPHGAARGFRTHEPAQLSVGNLERADEDVAA